MVVAPGHAASSRRGFGITSIPLSPLHRAAPWRAPRLMHGETPFSAYQKGVGSRATRLRVERGGHSPSAPFLRSTSGYAPQVPTPKAGGSSACRAGRSTRAVDSPSRLRSRHTGWPPGRVRHSAPRAPFSRRDDAQRLWPRPCLSRMPWGSVQPAPLLQHQLQAAHAAPQGHATRRCACGQRWRAHHAVRPPRVYGRAATRDGALHGQHAALALKLIECDPRLAVARGLESIDIAASRIAAARKKSDGAARSQCKPIKRSRRSAFEAPATR